MPIQPFLRSSSIISIIYNNTYIVITLVTHVPLEHWSHTSLLAQHRNYGVPVHHDVREALQSIGLGATSTA